MKQISFSEWGTIIKIAAVIAIFMIVPHSEKDICFIKQVLKKRKYKPRSF